MRYTSRSRVPTTEAVQLATELIEVAKGNFKLIGKIAESHVHGILRGVIANAVIEHIPRQVQNPTHRVMRLASVLTQYDINR